VSEEEGALISALHQSKKCLTVKKLVLVTI